MSARRAHIIGAASVDELPAKGGEMTALCGKAWTPSRFGDDARRLGVCADCVEMLITGLGKNMVE
jgi:hypothetical protein